MCFRHLGFIPRRFQYRVCYRISSVFFLSRLDRLNCVFTFSPGISLSVCSCSASSSGLVRIGTYLLFLSVVSYTIGVPVSSGIWSSSSSSPSSSVSLSARFLFWTIFSLPFRISRRISSQRPSFPSSPRKQCRFFRVYFTGCVHCRFFSVLSFGLKQWIEIKIRLIFFPVSVFTVLLVPLIAVCILF